MPPSILPHNFSPTLDLAAIIQKRSRSCEANYSSECSTHRTVLLIVSIFVGAFLFIGFALTCIMKRGRRKAQERAQAQAAARYPYRELRLLNDQGGFPVVTRLPVGRPMADGRLTVRVEQSWRKEGALDERGAKRDEAPPPYTPRTPEAARMRD